MTSSQEKSRARGRHLGGLESVGPAMKRLLRHLDRAVLPGLARLLSVLVSRPGRAKAVTAAGLAATAAAIVVVGFTTHEQAKPRQGAAGPESLVRVGVAGGQSIPSYLASSRSELKSLAAQAPSVPGEVYALVSLEGYLAPGRLTPVLGGIAVAEVYARVPLPQRETEIVRIPAVRIPEDVVSGMRQLAVKKENEADGLRELAAKLSEVNTAEAQLREGYLAGAAVAQAEAEAYRAGCTCVYAAVVRASPVVLEHVAGVGVGNADGEHAVGIAQEHSRPQPGIKTGAVKLYLQLTIGSLPRLLRVQNHS